MDELKARVNNLEQKVDKLSEHFTLAYKYLDNDPQSSLTKSRIILEKIIFEVYTQEMKKPPISNNLGAMLSDRQFTVKIERRILSRIHSIRDMANLGPHGEFVNQKDASRVLNDLCDVVDWYINNNYIITRENDQLVLLEESKDIKDKKKKATNHLNNISKVLKSKPSKWIFLILALASLIFIIFNNLADNETEKKIDVQKIRCIAITKNGTRCKRYIKSPEKYCWQHKKKNLSNKNKEKK